MLYIIWKLLLFQKQQM
uniref:Uncharacterized protein n=1 Tax=Romanomermis culicivorax TaxID=13658 RepID=A0A915JD48_ROMCU